MARDNAHLRAAARGEHSVEILARVLHIGLGVAEKHEPLHVIT
jgi:hypothetical protein